MAVRNMLVRLSTTLKQMVKGILRGFQPEHDDYPKTGTTPLKHDIYKEDKKHKSHYNY